MVDKRLEDSIIQFVSITGSSTRDARKFLERYRGIEGALDAYYNNPNEFAASSRQQTAPATPAAPSGSKLVTLFNKYKDADGDEITVDGTLKLCEDLKVDPEDVVLLAVAFELKSPRVGQWTKQGWTDGWKALGSEGQRSLGSSFPSVDLSVLTY
ncbi:hypothetical protein H0H93_014807 [Arthromyces matolae]|nr:hypothetical protein H0H93_014807 [Arthromyces matolae]